MKILNLIYLYLGKTSLIIASQEWKNGNTDVVKILLENGADIKAKDKSG